MKGATQDELETGQIMVGRLGKQSGWSGGGLFKKEPSGLSGYTGETGKINKAIPHSDSVFKRVREDCIKRGRT